MSGNGVQVRYCPYPSLVVALRVGCSQVPGYDVPKGTQAWRGGLLLFGPQDPSPPIPAIPLLRPLLRGGRGSLFPRAQLPYLWWGEAHTGGGGQAATWGGVGTKTTAQAPNHWGHRP